MDLNLKGKVALVTGGGTGIGAGTCEVLAEEGVDVAVSFRLHEAEARRFVRKLSRARGTRCIAVQGDVARAEDAERMVAEVTRGLGGVDILVNNAGVWPTEDLRKCPMRAGSGSSRST